MRLLPDEIIAQEITEGNKMASGIYKESQYDTFNFISLLKETSKAYYVEITSSKEPNLKVWFPKAYSDINLKTKKIKVYRPIAEKNVIKEYHKTNP